MMESTKLRYERIKIILIVLNVGLLHSCHESRQTGMLECLLDNIKDTGNKEDILVGQHNGWSDTTALIIITYHKKSMNIPIVSELKGKYKGHNIYFYQTNIDSLDDKRYEQISNNIPWDKNLLEIEDKALLPPYDPMEVQIEYNIGNDCIGGVVKGKGFLANNFAHECQCENDGMNK